jgi:hypothetical protein
MSFAHLIRRSRVDSPVGMSTTVIRFGTTRLLRATYTGSVTGRLQQLTSVEHRPHCHTFILIIRKSRTVRAWETESVYKLRLWLGIPDSNERPLCGKKPATASYMACAALPTSSLDMNNRALKQ